MYPLNKGKTASQAHVGLPDGTFEEEHGRKGFYGKASHLYHAHAPTGWTRFEGKLRPHLFDLNKLEPTDLKDPQGTPIEFLGNNEITVAVSRRSKPMPFYFRNADGDEMYFVHRGSGVIETDFGPLRFEKGDYINLPRAVTYRVVPETEDNFFLIFQSKAEFEQPEKGLLGQHALYDPAVITTPEPSPYLDDTREWEVRIKSENEFSKVFLSIQSNRRGGMEGRSDGVEDQPAGYSTGVESSSSVAAERTYNICDAGGGGVQFSTSSIGAGTGCTASAVFPSQHRL